LLAQYAAMFGSATTPAVEDVLMIDPAPLRIRCGRACFEQRNAPVTLTANVRCQSSTERVRAVPGSRTPA
jgi:hypothetical protein